jgi:hypothetical protein
MKNREVKEARRSAREGDYDSLPRNSSMKPKSRRWDDRKQLNEYLTPLVRYLKKNCGRPWDKVYSEICENMDRRGIVQDHIFQHLFDYVERNPIFKDGKPHRTGYGGLSRLYKSDWSFYVDKGGTLRQPKEKRPPWRIEKDNLNIIKTKDSSIFIIKRESDGVWFKASLADWEDSGLVHFVCGNPVWVTDLLGAENICSKKVVLKTLSKREKKEHSLL